MLSIQKGILLQLHLLIRLITLLLLILNISSHPGVFIFPKGLGELLDLIAESLAIQQEKKIKQEPQIISVKSISLFRTDLPCLN